MANMATVNFQCGHCNNLMAVGSEFLGQQVRCPHCQQVVVAPPPAAPTVTILPPAPEIHVKQNPDDEPESIFGQAVDTDDLFGRAPKASLEMPAPNMQLEPTFIQMPGTPGVGEQGHGNGPFASSANLGGGGTALDSSSTNWMPRSSETMIASSSDPEVSGSRPIQRRRDSGSLFTSYVMIVLIPYAIFITVVAIILFSKNQRLEGIHPLEMMRETPDVPDANKAKRVSEKQVFDRIAYNQALPAKLLLTLGQTLQMGDLEVQPLDVEQKRVRLMTRNDRFQPSDATEESLVLHVRMKNISPDVVFRPTDPTFDFRWSPSMGDRTQPFTYLQIGQSAPYFGDNERNPKEVRYYIPGQEDHERFLRPGEQIKTCFYTRPDDKVALYLARNRNQPLVWRVQLRRGLVQYQGKEFSCSFVFGVEFKADQIKGRH
jgi:phage FluMu protein Com